MDTLPSQLFFIALLICIAAVYRCAELAVENVSEAKFAKLADEGSMRAKRLVKLLKEPNKLYDSIRLVIILAELVLAAFVATEFSGWLMQHTVLSSRIGATCSAVGGLIILLLIFGVYIPKRLAMQYSEAVSMKLSGVMLGTYYIATPFVFVFSGIANLILRIFGVRSDAAEEVTEEEIRLMVDIGSESGAIDPEEKEMIHNIFELDDTPAKDIMTHRTDISLLWMEDGIDEWEKTISESNHSVYPVCGENVDDIKGILNSRDFYKMLRNDAASDVTAILRAPYFVPESIKADDLFRQMQKNKTHFAVVLDEYGGLGGIISMSDLLEEIVGTLSNEYDTDEDEIVQLDENTWKILGSADIDLVSDALSIDLPLEEYNTFAGMILSELGSIPADGSTPELEAFGLQIRVTKIEDHRIEETVVCKIEPEAEEDKKKDA